MGRIYYNSLGGLKEEIFRVISIPVDLQELHKSNSIKNY